MRLPKEASLCCVTGSHIRGHHLSARLLLPEAHLSTLQHLQTNAESITCLASPQVIKHEHFSCLEHQQTSQDSQ